MKNKIRKKIGVPIVVFGLIAIATLTSVSYVNAQQIQEKSDGLASAIASKFKLNEDDVRETLANFEEKHSNENFDSQRQDHAGDIGYMNNMVDKTDADSVTDVSEMHSMNEISDVNDVNDQNENHDVMMRMFEDKVDNVNGTLTSGQRFAILEKHNELERKMDNLYNLSREDKREIRADMHDEMEAWAQQNNIDMSRFNRMFNDES